jgi:Protein of unknown function (DUF4232)
VRRTSGAALALLATTLLTPTLAVAGSAATAAPAAAAATCATASLSAAIHPGSPGAGQRYATVVLTNRSASSCTVQGYGGLALLGARGVGVPTDLRRVTPPAPGAVLLLPGASARSLLHWSVIAGPGENPSSACEPTATAVVVTPPDQSTAALLGWGLGPVCSHGLIEQSAYVAGAATF